MWFGEFSASGRGRSRTQLVFLEKSLLRSILEALSSFSMPRLEDFPIQPDPERKMKRPIPTNRRREFADRREVPELEAAARRVELMRILRNEGANADELE